MELTGNLSKSTEMEDPNDHELGANVAGKRPRTEYHPWQRRKFKTGVDVHSADNVYVTSSHFWQDIVAPLPHQVVRRPLPSTTVLTSTQTASEELSRIHQAPFLQNFFKSVGYRTLTNESKIAAQEQSAEGDPDDEMHVEDLDKASLSTITPSQHRRYLKLIKSEERRTPAEKAHWKQLRDVIPAEQARYRQAVQKFWLDHKNDRLLLGFLSSSSSSSNRLHAYCQWACQRNLERKLSLSDQIPKFGKCRQVLSLRSLNEASLPDVATLDFQRIFQPENIPSISELPVSGSQIHIPLETNSRTDLALLDDTRALELASKYKATMMVTDTTLETLLRVPDGTTSTSWLLPVTIRDEIITLEQSLPQAFATPRSCLTCGLEEGLCQQVDSTAAVTVSGDKNNVSSDIRYEYTLWTLPSSASRRFPLKVLIRSAVLFKWEDSGNPLRIRAHVEYFPERGEEIVSLHELSLWILDQMLLKSTQMCRVDGRTGSVLRWHEAGVAHAFASDTHHEDPMLGFAQVIQLFHAISTIDFGREGDCGGYIDGGPFRSLRSRLLSLPSLAEPASSTTLPDPFSVSVHAPAKDDELRLVDIDPFLQKADGVVMNVKALQECQRPWRWDLPDRIPYTFPSKSNETTTTISRESKKQK
jgi:hypothetical protein